MTSTVLTLIQNFTDKMGLPTPNALVGATDKSTKQYRSLLRETVADLGEYRWQNQRVRRTFNSVAGQLQGLLTTLFGADYFGMEQDSMWNNTRIMRVYGPISDQVFNALQTIPNSGPTFQFYLSRDSLYLCPNNIVANEVYSAIIISNYCVLALGNPANYQQSVTNDADTLVFPDNVVQRFFEAKWRKQKGESGWEDDMNEAMGLIAKNIVKDGGTRLSLSVRPNYGPQPGIVIPPGNWP
jgi:hypothetical protein